MFEIIWPSTIAVFFFFLLIIFSKKISKLEGSLASKSLSVVLLGLDLFLLIILLVGIIGVENGLLLALLFPLFIFLLVLFFSFLITFGIRLVFKNKNLTEKGEKFKQSFNLIFGILLFIFLLILFYGKIITTIAKLTKDPSLCFSQIEIKDEYTSFIFTKGAKDSCILNFAYLKPSYCYQTEDSRKCIENVVGEKEDADICYLEYPEGGYLLKFCLRAAAHKKSLESQCANDECYMKLANETKNVIFCDDIENIENKISCVHKIAKEKNNKSICSIYSFSNESKVFEKCLEGFPAN